MSALCYDDAPGIIIPPSWQLGNTHVGKRPSPIKIFHTNPGYYPQLHADVGGNISDGDEDSRKLTITRLQERLQEESQARVQAEREAQVLRQNLRDREKEQASSRALIDTLKSRQDQLQCRVSETASLLSQLEVAVAEVNITYTTKLILISSTPNIHQ